ncbi:hypothetical protein GCM10010172_66420 [Paractinoplanes ferrugineus]|uniref:Uncharacterized protein n=1 Tax=Paractinoplanes ferrugineus TaxID=113564 RepID=A0A919J4F2_9ACTN|nr:hypothetical protein Afe05nite_50370 [Actinoplanes ferrugineus]
MLIGASIAADKIPFYEPLFPRNDIMRIFPVDVRLGHADLKVFPDWSDKRLAYCERKGTIPFLSSKVDGNPAGLERIRQQLEDMPGWLRDNPSMQVFVTDRHEPEDDLERDGHPEDRAVAYRANFAKYLHMIEHLSPRIRAKVRCGPVLMQYWTEHKGKFEYETYDPGTGDFFGVDCYVDAGTDKWVMSPQRLPKPADFLKHIKAYAHGPADARPRVFPELGLIGMPDDHDGKARATWLRAVHDEVSTWHPGTPGWKQRWSFAGWIWWNQTGKNTGPVHLIGGRRDFALDDRTVDAHTVVKLNPPRPLQAFNAIREAEHPARPRTAAPEPAAVNQ